MFRLDRLATWILISAVIASIVYTYLLSKTVKQQDEYIDELSEELSTTRAEVRGIAFRVNSELHHQLAPTKTPAAAAVTVSVAPIPTPAAPAKPALMVIQEEPEVEELVETNIFPEQEPEPESDPVKPKEKSAKTKKNA